ncbi:glycoside hydrolase family 19 protein [Dysgonomonas capnocytophagoides]|uniref:glycoside hydrolase family 19 protein n=1 Tax=Dysgonomonas capnocytophagoides TaxID=45254 RepID=UPI003342475F
MKNNLNNASFVADSFENKEKYIPEPLTDDQLKRIYPNSTKANRDKYLPWINRFAVTYDVDTYERLCAFLAQIGHESGQLRYVEEIASGAAYDTGKKAISLGNTPEADGDGQKYKGRGLIQVTGRRNYDLFNKWVTGTPMGVDFVENPELLKEPEYAVLSAFWYWDSNNLNRYATLKEEDFRKLTKSINGGYNGYADRVNIWNRAKEVLK